MSPKITNTTNAFSLSIFIKEIGWKCIIVLLLLLSFQPLTIQLWPTFRFLRRIDEFSIITFFFLFAFLNRGKFKRNLIPLVICMISFIFFGLISGFINQNSVLVTSLGIFDYLKNFLPIVLLCFVRIPEHKLSNLYTLLYNFALVLCTIAICQEIGFWIGISPENMGMHFVDIRLGILRTSSLMVHPNLFSLYILLFLILDIAIYNKIRITSFLLFICIILAFSRMVWVACYLSLLVLTFKTQNRKMFFTLAIITALALLILPFFFTHTSTEMGTDYYRGYALQKSFEIWSDHPISGVGPGMYGGVISLRFDSPIYAQYNFSDRWFNYMKGFNSLDQFWPQAFAETGITGASTFMVLIFLLWYIPHKTTQTLPKDCFRNKMLQGLSLIPIPLTVYLLGSGLNLAAFLLTYSILLGLCLGNNDEGTSHKQILIP